MNDNKRLGIGIERRRRKKKSVESMIRIIAGTFVFVSSLLGYFVHPYWLFFTMFVGLNLFQFGFTGVCPLAWGLRKVGFE